MPQPSGAHSGGWGSPHSELSFVCKDIHGVPDSQFGGKDQLSTTSASIKVPDPPLGGKDQLQLTDSQLISVSSNASDRLAVFALSSHCMVNPTVFVPTQWNTFSRVGGGHTSTELSSACKDIHTVPDLPFAIATRSVSNSLEGTALPLGRQRVVLKASAPPVGDQSAELESPVPPMGDQGQGVPTKRCPADNTFRHS